MNRLQKLFRKLRNRAYREAFVSARVAAAIGAQIAALREKRGWNQQQLAEYAGMKQPRIALLEKGDYESFSFKTLKRLASAFGVAIRIDFLNFADFIRWSESFNSESVLTPESFDTTSSRVDKSGPIILDDDMSNTVASIPGACFVSGGPGSFASDPGVFIVGSGSASLVSSGLGAFVTQANVSGAWGANLNPGTVAATCAIQNPMVQNQNARVLKVQGAQKSDVPEDIAA